MAARNQEKAAAAVERHPRAAIAGRRRSSWSPLDLGSQASVRAAAEQILAAHERIDLLINNAGVMGIPERKTADGFEMQFGINHLGHWTLTALLMPALLRGRRRADRHGHEHRPPHGPRRDPANPHLEGRYGPWRAYGQSKLANFHFGLGLQRQLEAAGAPAASLIAHPGLSNTDLQAVSVQETGGGRSQRFFHGLAGATGMSPARGRAAAAARSDRPGRRAAASSTARGWSTTAPPVRKPIFRRLGMDAAIARLWEVSERETGIKLDVSTGGPGRRLTMAVTGVDRAAAVRQALRTLVAERGFHGASMSAVAAEAGVATGTAYTHYASKDELVLAAYLETKAELAAAATSELDPAAGPAERFRSCSGSPTYRHLAANREHALFLLQVDCSPYSGEAHEAALAVRRRPAPARRRRRPTSPRGCCRCRSRCSTSSASRRRSGSPRAASSSATRSSRRSRAPAGARSRAEAESALQVRARILHPHGRAHRDRVARD